MAEDDRPGPFALPGAWVHADKPPAWSDLGDAAVAVVRWRRDRWPSLERLHALEGAARRIDGAALAVGLHGPYPGPKTSPELVRDALLMRGAWAPTGLLETEGAVPQADEPGQVLLVREGEIEASFEPDDPIEEIQERWASIARPGEVHWRPRGAAAGPWPLAFPGDVSVGGSRLAVADTGHNRIVVARPGGEIIHLVGDGVPGQRDGPLDEARFDAPRGVAWRDEALLVADTGNDAIRRVDPTTGEVSTLLQTPRGSLPAGLAVHSDGPVLAALAGAGQVAGLEDGQLRERVELGHPVDVVHRGSQVFVADLEGSRLLEVTEGGSLEPLWEGGPFVEPTGLLAEERLAVADPVEGTIVELDRDGGTRELLAAGAGPESPMALDREAQRLVVADGGGHHLWRHEPGAGEPPARVRLTESPLSLAEHIRLDPIELAPEGRLELSVSYILTGASTPSAEDVQLPTASGPVHDFHSREPLEREEGRIRAELEGHVAASGSLRIRWNLTGGEVGHEAAWDLPVVVRPGAEERLRLALSTSPPTS